MREASCAKATGVNYPEMPAEIEQALPEVLGREVTETEKNGSRALLQQHQDVFALTSADLGRTDLLEHTVEVGITGPSSCLLEKCPCIKWRQWCLLCLRWKERALQTKDCRYHQVWAI